MTRPPEFRPRPSEVRAYAAALLARRDPGHLGDVRWERWLAAMPPGHLAAVSAMEGGDLSRLLLGATVEGVGGYRVEDWHYRPR